MDEQDTKAKIFYFCRKQFYNSMLGVAQEGVERASEELCFTLYQSVALVLCNRAHESIRILESLKSETNFYSSSLVTLMYAQRMMGSGDKEAFFKMDVEVRDYKKSATAIDLYNTAFVLFAFKKYEKALDYLDKALVIEPNFSDGLCLKGWTEIYLVRTGAKENVNITDIFEESLQNDKRNLDASLGLAQSLTNHKHYEEALSCINKAVVRFPSVNLPLIQKMLLHFTMQEWDQAIEVKNRIVHMDGNNLDALQVNILLLLCHEARYDEAAKLIKKYSSLLESAEPKCARLLLKYAQLFSRLCNRNSFVLSETYKMVEKSVQMSSNNAEFISELGYHCILQKTYKDARRFYKSATKIDDSSVNALVGMTLCELMENGKTEQIIHQVEFLTELQGNHNLPTLLLYMQAKLSDSQDLSLQLLDKACDIQLKAASFYPYGPEYLLELDVDVLLELAKLYLEYTPQSPNLFVKGNSLSMSNAVTEKAENILKIIVSACPGLHEALYLLAKVQHLNGETNKATNTLQQILNDVDASSSDAYLLMAQIQVNSNLFERARHNLEVGLSRNFEVRENPLYHFINGLIEKHQKNIDEAIKCFTTALSLQSKSSSNAADKASIYIELIDVHTHAGQAHEAAKLLDDAREHSRGTSEEARFIILGADHCISQHNVQGAVDMLGKIKSSDSYYLEAKTKLAKVLLDYRMDKRAFLQCYKEMVESNPGPDSYILLGDAYLHILRLDEALEAYEKALASNPKDPFLTSKMGKALVKTHHYAKAIAFYKDTIKLTENPELKLQLADLYMQLKQFDNGETILVSELELERHKNLDDVVSLQFRTKLLVLLAKIQEKSGSTNSALVTLKNAKENQNRVRKRLLVEQTVVPQEEIKALIDINVKLAELSSHAKNNQEAIQHFKDALSVAPDDSKLLTALAKLYMHINHLELCQQTCASLLKLDPHNEVASVMMADIAFRKVDFDMASFHFTHLLSSQPDNWKVLARLIEVMRRTGELDEVPQYLQQAEQSCENATSVPGFCFCTALYEWYSGNLNNALKNFNNARQDSEWGKKAICNMIEICLNPEDELLGEQVFDADDVEYRDSRSMALKTAERLLRELKQRVDGDEEDILKQRLLANFLLLATKEKLSIDRALEDFVSIASEDEYRDHAGPIFGLATAYTMLKQSQRAKNQLKRVVKTVWTFEDAEYLERCWLLLADYYVQSAKYDLASELLKRVLQHNKACTKAYEYSGYIAEKEQEHKDAATYYDGAWKFGGKSNPSVGFRLAYNFMKCKRYADAVDVAQHVLRIHPDYPRIRKDVLDKSVNNLRT